MRLLRAILFLTALDSLLVGLWALTRPADLFALLRLAPPGPVPLWSLTDPLSEARLWPLTGLLTLAHAPCLILALPRPARNAGLILPPLIGRGLLAAIWLWLLAAGYGDARALLALAAHDAVVIGLYGGCLVYAWRIRRFQEAPSAIMD